MISGIIKRYHLQIKVSTVLGRLPLSCFSLYKLSGVSITGFMYAK